MLPEQIKNFREMATLKDGAYILIRPMVSEDLPRLLEVYNAVNEDDMRYFRHYVKDPAVIQEWCEHLDYGKVLPILALADEGRHFVHRLEDFDLTPVRFFDVLADALFRDVLPHPLPSPVFPGQSMTAATLPIGKFTLLILKLQCGASLPPGSRAKPARRSTAAYSLVWWIMMMLIPTPSETAMTIPGNGGAMHEVFR